MNEERKSEFATRMKRFSNLDWRKIIDTLESMPKYELIDFNNRDFLVALKHYAEFEQEVTTNTTLNGLFIGFIAIVDSLINRLDQGVDKEEKEVARMASITKKGKEQIMKGNHRSESRLPRTIDSARTVQAKCIYCEDIYSKPKRTQTNVCFQNACQDRLFEARRIQKKIRREAKKL